MLLPLRPRAALLSALLGGVTLGSASVRADSPEIWHGHRRAAEVRPVSRVDSFPPETADYALQTAGLPECLRSLTELSPGTPPAVVLPADLSSELAPASPPTSAVPSWDAWWQSADSAVRSTRRLIAALEAQREWSQCVAHADAVAAVVPHPSSAGVSPTAGAGVGPKEGAAAVAPGEPTARLAVDQFAWILAVMLVAPLPVVVLLLVLLRRHGRTAGATSLPEPTWTPVTGDGPATPAPHDDLAGKRFDLGPTYEEQREAERRAAEQQDRALLQQIFEENRKLQQQLAQPESAPAQG